MADLDEIELLLAQEDDHITDEKSFFEFADLNRVITDLTADIKKNANDLRAARKSEVDKKLLDEVLRFNESIARRSKLC